MKKDLSSKEYRLYRRNRYKKIVKIFKIVKAVTKVIVIAGMVITIHNSNLIEISDSYSIDDFNQNEEIIYDDEVFQNEELKFMELCDNYGDIYGLDGDDLYQFIKKESSYFTDFEFLDNYPDVKTRISNDECNPEFLVLDVARWVHAQTIGNDIGRKKYLIDPNLDYRDLVIKYCKVFNLDKELTAKTIAIVQAETSFKEPILTTNNNYIGAKIPGSGKNMCFDTPDIGAIYAVRHLNEKYYKNGITEFVEIQKTHAPIGAGNDPTNLNNNWLNNTNLIFAKELERLEEDKEFRL